MAVVETRKITKVFEGDVVVVRDIDLRTADGEFLVLLGPSGCGKTTTALSLVKLLPSNARIVEGSIKLFGIDLVPKSENAMRRYRWREISIVFQGAMNALNPVRRVGEQIAEPLEERLDIDADEARKRAGELLELVGIPRARVYFSSVRREGWKAARWTCSRAS